MVVLHPMTAFITAVEAVIATVGSVASTHRGLLHTGVIIDSGYPAVDIAFMTSVGRWRLTEAVDELATLVLTVFANNDYQSMLVSEDIRAAIHADITVGGACLKCVYKGGDIPRLFDLETGKFYRSIFFDVELRENV